MKQDILNDLKNGIRPIDVQNKYGISKQTLYNIKKVDIPNNKEELTQKIEQLEKSLNIKRDTPIEKVQVADMDDSKRDNLQQLLDPVNMKNHITQHEEDDKKHSKIPKSLINEASKKLKEQNETVKTSKKQPKQRQLKQIEEEIEEDEEEKKRLICKIRQYIFAFEDNRYLIEFIGQNKDKYVLSLNNKPMKELNNILEYIQFHVRNKEGSTNMLESAVSFISVVIEKVGSFGGLYLDGLSLDIQNDLKNPQSDLKRSLIEMSIEMDINKYFNSPKLDVFMSLSGKVLFTHQKNKHLGAMKSNQLSTAPQPAQSTETILKSSLDNQLKEKYQDL